MAGHTMKLQINLPKKAPSSLVKRVEKAVKQINNGTAVIRKSNRFGYRTLTLGHCERAVLIENTLHIFNKHSNYEKFINNAAHA